MSYTISKTMALIVLLILFLFAIVIYYIVSNEMARKILSGG
jgi:hypothetical protein